MKKLIREGEFILVMFAVLLAAGQVKAQTAVQWNGGTGNWSNAGDWNIGVVPNNAGLNIFNVTIDNAPTVDTVTLDINATVNSLTLGALSTLVTAVPVTLATGTLQNAGTIEFLGADTLNVSGLATNSGTIDLTGGATGNFASVNNTGLVEVGTGNSMGTLDVAGTFTNNAGGTLLLSSPSAVANTNAINNLGTVTLDAGSTLNLTGGGSGITTVAAGATFNVGGTLNVINSGVASNALASLTSVQGTLNLTNGATTTILPLNNTFTLGVGASGTVNVGDGSTLGITGSVDNVGLFETGGSSPGHNAISVSGTFANAAGAALALNDSGDVASLNNLNNSGTVTVDEGATLKLTGTSASSNFGAINLQGGALSGGNLNNSGTVTALAPSSGSGASSIELTGILANEAGGTVDLAAPGSFALVGGLTNSGTLAIGSGAFFSLTNQPSGVTDIGAGSEIDVAGSFNSIIGGATTVNALSNLASVEGTLVLENGQSISTALGGGTLTVSSTGTINLQRSTTLIAANGSVTNSGIIETNGGDASAGQTNVFGMTTGFFTNNSGAQFNVGDFDDTHDVANLGTLVNNGSIYVGTGATLNVANAITSIAAGSSLTVKGSFNQTNGVNGGVIGSGIAAVVPINGALTLENGQTNTIVSQVNPESGQVTTLAVGAGGNLTLSGAGTTLNVQDMFFSNAGTVSIGKGTALNLVDTGANLGIDFTLNEGIDLRVVDADTISAGETLTVGGSFNIDIAGAGPENALGLLQQVSGVLNLQNGQTTTITTPINATPGLNVSSGGQINLSGGTTLNVGEPLGSGGTITTGSQGGNNTLSAFEFVNGGRLSLEGAGDQAIFSFSFNNEGPTTIDSGATLTTGNLLNGSAIQVNPGGALEVTSTFQNDAAISLGQAGAAGPEAAATLVVGGGSFSLSGPPPPTAAGTVILYNASDAISTNAPNGLLVNNSLLIEGAGNIGEGEMQILNQGSIFANATDIESHTDGTVLTIQPNGGGFTNGGGMEADPGNTMQIDVSDISFTGTSSAFGFTNNNVVNAFGTVELTDRDPNTSVNIGNNGVINVGSTSNPGTLEFNGSNTTFNLFGAGNISMFPGATITGVTGAETLVNEAGHSIFGSGSITNLNLTNEGTLIASQAGVPLSIAPADGTLVNAGNGLLEVANGTTLSITGSVNNSAAVSVQQGNVLALSQAGTYTQTAGTTDVNGTLKAATVSISGGTLSGAGVVEGASSSGIVAVTIANGGSILPGETGAPGTLTIDGNLTFDGGTFDEGIGSASPGGFGVLDINGALDLTDGGKLDVTLLNGFTPTLGQTFEIAMANSLIDPNGLFTITDPTIGDGEFWSVSSDATDVFLTTTSTPTPEPGSIVLLGAGLLSLSFLIRKKNGGRAPR